MSLFPKVRGKESTTLVLVLVAFIAETYVFVTKGTPQDLAAYGTAVMMTLGIWLGREWTEKVKVAARAGD